MSLEENQEPPTESLTLENLQDKLDALWENYLNLLDQYDRAQKELQKQMASGFFMLAQAGFKSPNRIRYGQDYYDERMQATRRVAIHSDQDNLPTLTTVKFEEESNDSQAKEEPTQVPTPPATPVHKSDNDLENEPEVEEEKDKKPNKGPVNPLHWYGILVPSQLRQAQSSFATAIQGPVAEATTAAQKMKRTEMDIRKLRKEIKKAEKKRNTNTATTAAAAAAAAAAA